MATTTSDDAEREPVDQEAKRLLWDLRDSEQRLLFITFIGGLAANIGLVLVLGLSLALVREMHRSAIARDAVNYAIPGTLVVLMVAALLSPLIPKRWKQGFDRAGVAVVLVLSGLGFIVYFLSLIGYAAGIK